MNECAEAKEILTARAGALQYPVISLPLYTRGGELFRADAGCSKGK
jgi:hypothetical protein